MRVARSALLPLICIAAAATAQDYRDDVGYTRLRAELGRKLPRGVDVPVSQVEGLVQVDGKPAWLPDLGNAEFAGKSIAPQSLKGARVYSGHATAVGKNFYGLKSSMAPGISVIAAYDIDDWAGLGYLQIPVNRFLDEQPAISPARIANHSWVAEVPPFNGAVLRRVDWVIDRDEYLQVVGLPNGGNPRPLLGSAFNVIAVGRTDGQHSIGTAAVDSVYGAGRARPDLVVPAESTSLAAPVVAAASALLIELGHRDTGLSTDPDSRSTTSRAGKKIMNAERAEVVRAALLAGAAQATRNHVPPDITDYRRLAADRTANGLDRRYGAGQLDVYASFHVVAAGEQNSREDAPGAGGRVAAEGFDYDPHFGGARGANEVATYDLPAQQAATEFHCALVWNIRVDGGSPDHFDGTATLFNLDVFLYDVTDPAKKTLVASSASATESTEHLSERLAARHAYALEVRRAAGQPPFDWDYGIAWRIGPPGLPVPAAARDAGLRRD